MPANSSNISHSHSDTTVQTSGDAVHCTQHAKLMSINQPPAVVARSVTCSTLVYSQDVASSTFFQVLPSRALQMSSCTVIKQRSVFPSCREEGGGGGVERDRALYPGHDDCCQVTCRLRVQAVTALNLAQRVATLCSRAPQSFCSTPHVLPGRLLT